MAVAKAIKCTKCGADLELKSEAAKTVVCAHCGAQLDLTTEDYAFLAELRPGALVHPLRVGQTAQLDGTAFEIVGHIRYRQPDCFWDEYALLAADGTLAWLQYDDEEFSRYDPFVPTSAGPLEAGASRMTVDGEDDRVVEQGRATLETIEGELTWRARVGDAVDWLDGHRYAAEISPRELEWYRMTKLSRDDVAAAFGMTRAALDAGCYEAPDDDDDRAPSYATGGAEGRALRRSGAPPVGCVVVIVLFFVFFGIAAMSGSCEGDDDGYGGGGHYSGGGWSGGK